MTMTLVFPGGEHAQVRLDPGVAWVGSDPGANIVLPEPGVLPQHGQLHVSTTGVMLEVPHGNRVEVNGRRVDGLISLRPGDSVSFDHVRARLAGFDESRAAGASPHAANDGPGATTVRAVLPMFVLRGVTGGAFGRCYAVTAPVTLGRSPDCDIHLNAPGLSLLHARLAPADDGVIVEDLESSNGTFVNGYRVRRHKLRIGDEVEFDRVRFHLAGSGPCIADGVRAVRSTTAPIPPPTGRRWGATIAIGGMLVAMASLGVGYLL
ncbi:FHA domain-containing protein [Lysobacter niabensis]|uniref:FHA domain-containing protein n=1 Tax=Agrilutibacter niabensis TaxID=380628 RepID=UPI0036102E10